MEPDSPVNLENTPYQAPAAHQLDCYKNEYEGMEKKIYNIFFLGVRKRATFGGISTIDEVSKWSSYSLADRLVEERVPGKGFYAAARTHGEPLAYQAAEEWIGAIAKALEG